MTKFPGHDAGSYPVRTVLVPFDQFKIWNPKAAAELSPDTIMVLIRDGVASSYSVAGSK